MAYFEITQKGGHASVVMDGRKLHCVTKAEIVVSAEELTAITLSVIPFDGSYYEGEANVKLKQEHAEDLIRLGWTPPAETTPS